MSAINAFTISSSSTPSPTLNISQMSTVEAPPREKTDRNIRDPTDDGTSYDDEDANTNDVVRYNDAPMEYLEDEFATRNPDDPFHILLLDSTFSQSGRVTESYVSGCLTYVLGTPDEDALELTKMAAFNGMSCLGTWEREECLSLGRKLQVRDLVIRVVPFCEGGGRSWQAKDASSQGGGAVPNDYSSNSFQ
eukprot:CAMPEP_0198249754 /NCGR_PEP_ID=MMETSP1447-20131203/1165_1 /TAXON_ID=420782 /ORGANISM="Chaetoceros dichaeta, Strain CCMP1751" /LENGTH=191 /DNA_ID=CAMNT_0043934449 /DNA_START=118 /DNA_END=693 /DNA_ORIENTATION=+